VQAVLAEYRASGDLPDIATATALRAIIETGASEPFVGQAQEVLGPADNYGGRIAFRWLTPFSIFLAIVFGIMFLRDRAKGRQAPVSEATVQQAQQKANVSA